MNTLNTIFTVAVLLSMTYCMTSALACASDNDCFYGSICNKAQGICECSIPCNDFNNDLVCTNQRKRPLTRCKAVNLACELQQSVNITHFNPAIYFANKRNCRLVHAVSTDNVETFCKDQSLCFREGGICLEKNGERACRCNSNFAGLRCDNRIPIISASHDDQPSDFTDINVVSNQGPEINSRISAGNRLIIGKVAPYAALAILSCMLCCCFVARHYRRRKSENESEIEIDSSIEKQPQNIPQTKLEVTDEEKPSNRCDNIELNITRKNSLNSTKSKNDISELESAIVQVEINQSSSV